MTELLDTHGQPLLCPLFCGAERHEEPGPAPYGMTCPGFKANETQVEIFTNELLWRKEVAAAYGETLAASDEYTDLLQKRRDDAEQRLDAGRLWKEEHPDEPEKNPLRSKLTHQELQQAVNELVPEVVAKIDREIKKPVIEDFEPVINTLRVPPKNLSRRGPRIEVPFKVDDTHPLTELERKQARNVDDAALFLDPEQNS
jgi:hypothetical protein